MLYSYREYQWIPGGMHNILTSEIPQTALARNTASERSNEEYLNLGQHHLLGWLFIVEDPGSISRIALGIFKQIA